MKIISLIVSLLFLISSCADFNYTRTPANSNAITDNDVAKVFEFEKSNILGKEDYALKIKNHIDNAVLFRGTYSTGNEIAVEFVEDSTLPPNIAYYPEFRVVNNKYTISILHSKDAKFDQVASAELLDFLLKIKDEKFFMSHFAAFEMYYNAQEKDAIALNNLAKIRQYEMPFSAATYKEEDYQKVKDEILRRKEQWGEEKARYEVFEKNALKIQKAEDAARREVIDELDKAVEDQQFKTLVANNDRKGVAQLLKKYLPWEQMAPFEKKYWENYLSVIANPLPPEQRILVYRGVADDVVYAANEAGHAIEKEEAYKSGKVFFMSTMMTKNQGTWNRRLRSLTAMNEKFIGTNSQGESEFTKSSRIVTMFVKHSLEPKGSPFLSLTPKFSVARNFGAKKMSAYLLDPRAISFNFASRFKNEIEFLVPLTIFPDEVVGFYDAAVHEGLDNTEDLMKKQLEEKMVRAHGPSQGKAINEKILKATKEYFDGAFNRYEGKTTANVKVPEPNVVVKFFSNLFGGKKPVATPEVKIPAAGLSCIDLISQFWK